MELVPRMKKKDMIDWFSHHIELTRPSRTSSMTWWRVKFVQEVICGFVYCLGYRSCHVPPPPCRVKFGAGGLCRTIWIAAEGIHLPPVLDIPDKNLRKFNTFISIVYHGSDIILKNPRKREMNGLRGKSWFWKGKDIICGGYYQAIVVNRHHHLKQSIHQSAHHMGFVLHIADATRLAAVR
jgi:hypothetical protein